MNKSALKTFATSARKELLKKVEAKAMKIGVTEDNIKKADVESSDAIFINGRQLSREEKTQRDKLVARINQIGYKQVMEEVAYTWFNRFTALRFMEVNDYLPTGVRVLSSSNPNSADPDMLNEALELDLEVELDKEHIYNMKLNNDTEELFKYLIIKHCNDINRFLPFMFEKIDDYTEILFPEGLLAKDSFIRQMTDTEFIPESNWQKVEVIGWLYQYYIAEEKDRVIQAKKKYKTEEIPFATQLFTPDWIVRYMVQNSLGRYWVESHPEHRELLGNWEFYLENPNPEPEFEEKLAPYINKELKVEDIKCFDPAMGSGHILVYMFDVLYEIYSKCGYMEREIPRLIIENNLYGLDIDVRAYQLACFSVVMKALEYNSRFFRSIEREGLTLNLASIQETNDFNDEDIAYISGINSGVNYENTKKFINQFKNAKIYGSLIKVAEFNHSFYQRRLKEISENPSQDLFEEKSKIKALDILPNLLKQSEIMSMSYDIFVSNPPYMNRSLMNIELIDFIETHYNSVKNDLFSAFLMYGFQKTKENGHLAFISPYVWLAIKSYEYLREFIVTNKTISSMIELEYNAFEVATVPVCTYTIRNYTSEIPGEFVKLSDFKGVENQPLKTLEAIRNPKVNYRHTNLSKNFSKMEGMPIAYWASENTFDIFTLSPKIKDVGYSKKGLDTGNNSLYLRMWHEINYTKINSKWIPLNKGGAFRKWYGNHLYLIDWENNGHSLKSKHSKANIRNEKFYFQEGLTWSELTSGDFGARYSPEGFIFEATGPCYFGGNLFTMLAYMNSKVFNSLAQFTMSTMHYTNGSVANMPYKEVEVDIKKVKETIEISKNDWNAFETSWEFKKHPLLNFSLSTIESAFFEWKQFTENQFSLLKENEEKFNKLFIETYGMQEELTPEIEDKDVTIRKADLERDIKSYISYAIGCMFGRYSIDSDGLVYAGGEFDINKYSTFKADKDNILPILPGAYFGDDIVSRFIEFVRVTFGEEVLAENLDFIADTLGKKKGETAKETIRRYFLNDFFKDHVQTYKKRPIYWLFTSGKQKAFNCLIYMHRYDKTTLSRIRTDYLHEYQIRLDAEKKELLSIIEGDYTTKEISNAKKELKALDKKIVELKEFDELLHHMADRQIGIELDDGVTHNYDLFKELVPKII
jgi:hypothetical protein